MYEVVEVIANPEDDPLEVWFEPWGMPHTLAQRQSFRIVAVSEVPGRLEIEREGSRVVVYGWSGCTICVYCGEALVDDFSNKFPELPPGMSTKSFIGFMFGGPGGPSC